MPAALKGQHSRLVLLGESRQSFRPLYPRGRELLDEVYPSSTADVENEVSPHARWIVAAVLIVMFIGLFLIPGHS